MIMQFNSFLRDYSTKMTSVSKKKKGGNSNMQFRIKIIFKIKKLKKLNFF